MAPRVGRCAHRRRLPLGPRHRLSAWARTGRGSISTPATSCPFAAASCSALRSCAGQWTGSAETSMLIVPEARGSCLSSACSSLCPCSPVRPLPPRRTPRPALGLWLSLQPATATFCEPPLTSWIRAMGPSHSSRGSATGRQIHGESSAVLRTPHPLVMRPLTPSGALLKTYGKPWILQRGTPSSPDLAGRICRGGAPDYLTTSFSLQAACQGSRCSAMRVCSRSVAPRSRFRSAHAASLVKGWLSTTPGPPFRSERHPMTPDDIVNLPLSVGSWPRTRMSADRLLFRSVPPKISPCAVAGSGRSFVPFTPPPWVSLSACRAPIAIVEQGQ